MPGVLAPAGTGNVTCTGIAKCRPAGPNWKTTDACAYSGGGVPPEETEIICASGSAPAGMMTVT